MGHFPQLAEEQRDSRFTIGVLGACLLLLLAARQVLPVNPHTPISQYAHSVWTVQDGTLPSFPTAIAQTRDGYLWLGTATGLLRFDGARFVPWDDATRAGNRLASNRILALLAARDGSLWISDTAEAFDGHLYQWSNEKLVAYDEGKNWIYAFAEGKDGALWFLKSKLLRNSSGELCRLADGKTKCYGREDGLDFSEALRFVLDSQGYAWIAASDRLIRWKPGTSQVYQPPGLKANSGAEVQAVTTASDNTVYAGFSFAGPGMGLQHFVQGAWEPIRIGAFDSSTLKVSGILCDTHGALWVATQDQGIYRIDSGDIDHFTTRNGLSSDIVVALYEDAEGTVWVATSRGVENFRDLPVTSSSNLNGLCTAEPDSVLATHDGTIWIGGAEGVCALRDGRFTSILPSSGLPGHQVTSLLEDHSHHLWIGVDEGLYIFENGRFTPILKPDRTHIGFVEALAEDTERNVWVETSTPVRELLRIRDRKVQETFLPPRVPLAHPMAADPRGGIWLGLLTGNLARFENGRLDLFNYALPKGAWIIDLLVDSDGAVYGSTPFGVVAWRDHKQAVLSKASGLPCDEIYTLVSDREDDLWLYSKCGLVEVSNSDMQRWWKDPKAVLHPGLLAAVDGARPFRSSFEASAETQDGRLWFVNTYELQMIDPNHLPSNTLAPPVHIQDVIADRKRYPASEDIRLPARTRNLEIDYAALSFVAPQLVRFRYKLESRDIEWQDAGPRRQAFYTDLPPGHYGFHVIACNNDGLWNNVGATLEFSIAPAWYQTTWFEAACGLLFLLVLWTLYTMRVRQVAGMMRVRFNERLDERTRMARELHDTFLQTVQGSKMVVEDALAPASDAAKMRQALESVAIWLTQAVNEGRAALHALRISTTERNHLSEALRRAVEDPRIPATMNVSLATIGGPSDLHPVVRDEIYRIAFEAIRNAALHSKASRLEVEVRYAHDLSLTVTDNGVGIDPGTSDHGTLGHFGLQGMRERAARIRGKLTIRSSSDRGTAVTLTVPGSVIYRTAAPGLLQRLQERLNRLFHPAGI